MNKIKIPLSIFFILVFVAGIIFIFFNNFREESDVYIENITGEQKKDVKVENGVGEDSKSEKAQEEFMCGKKYLGKDEDGWRSYRDDEIGIQFKHPSELSVETHANNCNWLDEDNNVFYADKEKYDDRRFDETILYEPWQFSSESLGLIKEKPTCGELSKIMKNFTDEDEYRNLLPSSFFNDPNMCGVIQNDNDIVFYAIGLRDDAEGNPHIGGDMVIFKDNYFVVIEDVVGISNEKPQLVVDFELGKNKKDYTDDDWKKLRDLYRENSLSRIEKPEKELIEKIDILKQIGNSVEFDDKEYASNENWRIISGDVNKDCSNVIYSGEVELSGWYSLESGYIEKEWMFVVSNEDIENKKLPIKMVENASGQKVIPVVKIVDANPELEERLKKATKENPEMITIKGFSYYCEGSPRVSIGSAREVFGVKE